MKKEVLAVSTGIVATGYGGAIAVIYARKTKDAAEINEKEYLAKQNTRIFDFEIKENEKPSLKIPNLKIEDDKDKWNTFNKHGPCFQKIFKKVNLTQPKNKSKRISIFQEHSIELGESCLYVTWKKTTNENDYWYGVIRWEWALYKKNEGIVVYGASRNADTPNNLKIIWTGNVLKKVDDVWNYEFSNTFTDEATNSFPRNFLNKEYKEQNNEKVLDEENRNWGFAVNKAKACAWESDSNCSFTFGESSKTKEKEVIWLWKETVDYKDKLGSAEWSCNFNDWWDKKLGVSIVLNFGKELQGDYKEIKFEEQTKK